jgi:hypothetical protein
MKYRKPEKRRDASSSDNKGEGATCPLSKTDFKHCDWRGPLMTLKDHVFESHREVLRRFNRFECRGVANRVLLIFYQGEIFLYFKRITYTGHMYIFVRQVGLTHRLYSCRVRIASHDESREDIDTRFPINSITETLELSAETGKCLAFDVRKMKHFITYHEMDMVAIIE